MTDLIGESVNSVNGQGTGSERAMRRLLKLAAWSLLLGVVIVTLVPLGWRPVVVGAAGLERFLAFALLGSAWSLAYARHRLWSLAGLLVLAGLVEAAQALAIDRHGRFDDLAVKALGLMVGVAAGAALSALPLFRRRSEDT